MYIRTYIHTPDRMELLLLTIAYVIISLLIHSPILMENKHESDSLGTCISHDC